MQDTIQLERQLRWESEFKPLIEAIKKEFPDTDWSEISMGDVFRLLLGLPIESIRRMKIQLRGQDFSAYSKEIQSFQDLYVHFLAHCLDSQYFQPYVCCYTEQGCELALYKGFIIKLFHQIQHDSLLSKQTFRWFSICEPVEGRILLRSNATVGNFTREACLQEATSLVDNPPDYAGELLAQIERLKLTDPFWKSP